MASEVTRETRIRDLGASVRLKNVLCNIAKPYNRDTTVGDILGIPDHLLLREPNFGKVSLNEWKRLTAHLQEGFTEKKEEEGEAYLALKKARVALSSISIAHRNLAGLYAQLADIVLPPQLPKR
jgi:DNA-directed RNA polymerase alpha subunit